MLLYVLATLSSRFQFHYLFASFVFCLFILFLIFFSISRHFENDKRNRQTKKSAFYQKRGGCWSWETIEIHLCKQRKNKETSLYFLCIVFQTPPNLTQ